MVDRFDEPDRPLRRRVEQAQAFDAVAEQLDAQRQVVLRREDVDDAAAPAGLPRRVDEGRELVAALDQPRAGTAPATACRRRSASRRQPAHLLRRKRGLRQRLDRGDDDGRRSSAASGQQRQDAQAVAHGFGVGRQALVGERVATGEQVEAFVAAEPGRQLFD